MHDALAYGARADADVLELTLSCTRMPHYDSSRYKFSRPAEHVKALNVGSIPQKIFDDMTKYNDTSRGMNILSSRRGPTGLNPL